MTIEQIAPLVIGALALSLVAWWWLHHRHAVKKVHRDEIPEDLERMAPPSLHPVIDPTVCIGSAACVAACPEGQILALHRGRAFLAHPTACIGHGRCAAECPVGAISLVFGTSERGVDIPHVSGHFETNVPGVFIVGELGGMGLIRNAVVQGTQAMDHIAKLPRATDPAVADVLVVGAGPAGMAATLTAKKRGLRVVCIDQESLGGTINLYPRRKIVMLAPFELPYYGAVKARTMRKEELVAVWQQAVAEAGLEEGRELRFGARLEAVQQEGDLFVATTSAGPIRAARVVLAVGRRGTPRKLGVPGEELPHVAYSLKEAEAFAGLPVLVVGGGDSAIEAAVQLAEQEGTTVHLSYRGESFLRAKPKNVASLNAAAAAGRLHLLLGSQVTHIEERRATLTTPDGERTVEAQQVLIFAGGELPTPLLQRIGVAMERKFGTL